MTASVPPPHSASVSELLATAAQLFRATLLSVLGTAIELWLISAMMLRQRAVVLGAPVHAAAELRAAWRRLPSLLGCVLLGAGSVALGGLLLIAPGVFLLICYVVAMPVVLFEGLAPYAALVRSVRLIRPVWWKTLAACVFALLAFVVCALVFAALVGVFAGVLTGNGPAFEAIQTASSVASAHWWLNKISSATFKQSRPSGEFFNLGSMYPASSCSP